MDTDKAHESKPVFANQEYPPAADPQVTRDPHSGERYLERRKLASLRTHINRIIQGELSSDQLRLELAKLRRELTKHYERAYRAALKFSRLG